MSPPTFPANPNYTTFSKPQLIATQAVYQAYLSTATYKPALLNLHPRLDLALYNSWLSALNSELATRP
jgi:hypothetical protein